MVYFTILFWLALPLMAEMPGFYPETAPLVLKPESDSLVFSQAPAARGSVTLTRKGVLLSPGEDYRADYDRGLLFFLFAHPSPETLTLRYEKSSLDFKTSYFHRRQKGLPEAPESLKVEVAPEFLQSGRGGEETSLLLAGSKTIGVTLGSGNAMSIDQSLNLNIRGEIAKDVQIRAILTDQNMPFQPEGNTESIRELDRVLVEIETPRLLGALGDLVLTEDRTRFGNFRRKIKGAQAGYHDEHYRANAAVAVSEGLFRVMEFPGKEQQQGPYRLTSREGRTGIIVLAGTERVYIDGRLKKRGENNDYVVEYGNGQITFTPHCLITADNTILAEYEYAENEYPKNLVAAGGEAALLDHRLLIVGNIVNETDDDQHPIRAPLSAADRADLAKAGDTGQAVGSGAYVLSPDSVFLYRGFYVRAATPSLPDSHYVYHTPRARDSAEFQGVTFYDVEFQYTGFGKGDYRQDSIQDSTDHALSGTYEPYRTLYVYEGPGLGLYQPGHALPRPTSHRLGTLRYQFNPAKDFTFKGEVTGSDFDRNTLSSVGDHDNQGAATENGFSITLGKYLAEQGPGRFTLSGRQELIQKSFAPFSPVQNPYAFLRKWNLLLPADETPALSDGEGKLDYSPVPTLSVGAGGGVLALNEDKSRRAEADLRFSRRNAYTVQGLQEYTEADAADTLRTLYRTTASADKTLGLFTPRLNYTGEFKADNTAGLLTRKSDYQEGGAGLLYGRIGPLQGESSVTLRQDRVGRQNEPEKLLDSARAYTVENRLSLSGPGSLSMDLNVVNRRSRRLELGLKNNYRSDLVNFVMDVRPLNGALDQRLRYNLSSTLSQTIVDRYEPVPPGTGTHTRDPLSGDYVPKDGGDYIFLGTVADNNSSGENVNASEVSYRLFFYPGKLAALSDDSGFLKDLTFDTYILAGQDKLSDAYKGSSFFDPYVPDFNPYHVDPERSSRYEMNVKEDISVDSREKNLYLRLRANPRFRYNFQRTLGGFVGRDEWQTWFYSLFSRFAPIPDLLFEDELILEWIWRDRGQTDPLYDILNRRTVNTLTYSLNRSFSFPTGITAGLSVNRSPETLRVPYFILKPGVTYTLPGKGKIDASYEQVRVYADRELIFYEMAGGNLPGTTHRAELSAMFGLGKNLDLDFFYNWEKNEHDPKPVQRGSAQLKAFF